MWIGLSPLLGLSVIVILKSRGVLNLPSIDAPFMYFLIFNYANWRFLRMLISIPAASVRDASTSVFSMRLSVHAIALSKIHFGFQDFVIRMLPLIPVGLYFNFYSDFLSLNYCVGLISLVILGIGIGSLIAPLLIFFNDFSKLWGSFFPAMIFLSPVFYPIPSGNGILARVVQLNPLSQPLALMQKSMFETVDIYGIYFFSLLFFSTISIYCLVRMCHKNLTVVNQI